MKLSVLLCVYCKNDPERLDAVFRSMERQTRPADETVVVCDGALTDGIEKVLEAHANETVKLVRSEKNVGRGAARNMGIKECCGELIAICDADDISVPQRFELQLERFENDGSLAVVGGWCSERGDDDSVRVRRVPESDGEIKKMLRVRCPFNNMTVMMRKSALLKAGGYEEVNSGEDYIMWASMASNGEKSENIPQVLCCVETDLTFYKRRGGMEYFRRERFMMKRLLEKGIIGRARYLINVTQRFFVQVCLPNGLRRLFYRAVIRSKD
ncbi:MAG TPA: glycosyltransferase [Bacillota bacterium]|nr:glycosyltransferase [Bacillota bacterium]